MSKMSLSVDPRYGKPTKAAAPQPQEPLSLVPLSEATRMLAEARSLEDVRQIRDLAEAARTYARAHKLGIDAQNHAGTVAVEADIRRGEILAEMTTLKQRRGPGGDERSEAVRSLPDLSDLNTSRKEASNALAMADEADAVRSWYASAKEVTPALAARIARNAKAARRRAETPVPPLPPTCDIRLGDFRDVLADVADGSVDLILTDPPYPAEFLPLWDELGVFAARVLKPNGMLAAMSGQIHLPAIYAMLGRHLTYRWTMAYLTPGASAQIHARRVSTQWKPILVYGSFERQLFDVARSDREDKDHHGWGQSETGMADLLRLLADPGALVCDPFVGGGTTAVVAVAAGCSFIGAELVADVHETAVRRVAA